MAEVPAKIRQRVEERHRSSRWRIYVCAEPDGDRCGSGSTGVHRHCCAAAARQRQEEGPPPAVVWIEVVPRK